MPVQPVRDLLWMINGPSLVAGAQVAVAPALAEHQIDAERLQAFIDANPVHRVGRYFENLLHYWLVNVRRVDMVGSAIQVRDGNRTIGEVDFLYRDEAGELCHCEAAVKFFLHYPRCDESHYPGPNASDNFEKKTTKLFEQQLTLSAAHYPEVSVREAFVRGMIFYRGMDVPDEEIPAAQPDRLAPEHDRGGWIRQSELDVLTSRPLVGAVCEKPHWLAPTLDAELRSGVELADQLHAHFTERDHPLMISLRDPDSLAETERVFVVADSWPDAPGEQ